MRQMTFLTHTWGARLIPDFICFLKFSLISLCWEWQAWKVKYAYQLMLKFYESLIRSAYLFDWAFSLCYVFITDLIHLELPHRSMVPVRNAAPPHPGLIMQSFNQGCASFPWKWSFSSPGIVTDNNGFFYNWNRIHNRAPWHMESKWIVVTAWWRLTTSVELIFHSKWPSYLGHIMRISLVEWKARTSLHKGFVARKRNLEHRTNPYSNQQKQF